MRPLVIVGASSLGNSCISIASEQGGWEVLGTLDDNASQSAQLNGCVVRGLGSVSRYAELRAEIPNLSVHVAVGDPNMRSRIVQDLESTAPVDLVSIISPGAHLMAGSSVFPGTLIFPGAVVAPGAVVGKGCLLNANSSLGTGSTLGDFCSLAPGVSVGSEVRIGRRCYFGLNSAIKQGVTMGDDCVVGALSFVANDIGDRYRALGIPAAFSDL